jgi:hypothetical protein
MPKLQVAPTESAHTVCDQLLEIVQDGTVLVGTPVALAHSLGVLVSDLRVAIRLLLESAKVAVRAEAGGQIAIRLERRQPKLRPLMPPVVERRGPDRDVWIF